MENSNHQVILCGENPEMRLVRAGTEEEVAFASYWRCTFSPHGTGQLLVLNITDAALPGSGGIKRIYADNPPLARFVVDSLVQHFPGLQALKLPECAVTPAQLTQTSTLPADYRVTCQAEQETVEIIWQNMLEVRLLRTYPNLITEPETGYFLDVSNVICPVGAGTFTINQTPVQGVVQSFQDGTMHRSSAFLAFSETWIKHP